VGAVQLLGSDVGAVQLLGSDVGAVQLVGSDVGEVQLLGSDVGAVQLLGSDVGAVQLLGSDVGAVQLLGSDVGAVGLSGGLGSSGGSGRLPIAYLFASLIFCIGVIFKFFMPACFTVVIGSLLELLSKTVGEGSGGIALGIAEFILKEGNKNIMRRNVIK
ncbi:MAG: hypothetical protein HYT97_09535, partial [Elusimicrobia bacterium]|nr:hypothetical protein [Elusimicrobiota bacterium]